MFIDKERELLNTRKLNQSTDLASWVLGCEMEALAWKNHTGKPIDPSKVAAEAASWIGAAQMFADKILERWGSRLDTDKVNIIDSSYLFPYFSTDVY